MNFLQIGLGSMGKRRIRCLKSLGYNEILGIDIREDRRKEAENKYNITTISNLENINFDQFDAMIVSTPPDKHSEFIEMAINNKEPAFVEASVVLYRLEVLSKLAKKQNVFIAPSCTMKFHPAIKEIKNIVENGKYGKVTNFSYHSGQYLPDWHPWENVQDFYVSKKETGGCREIVPFELTWIVDIFGFPKKIFGYFGKTMNIGADIDDTYAISIDFVNSFGSMTVDVVSRYATRSLILNMEYGQVIWKWEENIVKLFEVLNKRWIYYYSPQGESAEGYNKNIIENMYIDETKSFIEAASGKGKFPNSLNEDIEILKLLEDIEKSNEHK